MTTSDLLATPSRVIEAMIFSSAEPVSEHVLKKHLPEDLELSEVLAHISSRYGEDSGLELRKVGSSWAIRTRADIAALLSVEKHSERPLSRAALEVLSIIAYHQPVTRAEIEEIRGVSISRGTMDILLELSWIKPRGRRRSPGRPLTWGTTEGFLDHFGLDDINALPGLEELEQAGLLRSGQSISDAGGIGDVFKSMWDDDVSDDTETDEMEEHLDLDFIDDADDQGEE
ncbi:MAG: SMC-Scp complex subunit ScpB [Alphaproteobacteria bacterium]|jgi:segregation and condensation protein B|nr:SMC-Scp complex subunit ScpB [Alphaproteobacteria bacterium]